MNLSDVAVYIPAFNAENTLPRVFSLLPKILRDEAGMVLVVDNASDDNTSEIAQREAIKNRVANFVLIRNSTNQGYGGSQKIGYQEVITRGFNRVIMLHGDAQYSPSHALQLLKESETFDYDLLFGSRISGNALAGGMPWHRYIGNRSLTYIQNMLLQTKISEFHSGYRVYKTSALKGIPLERLSSDYHFDTEIIICMIDKRMSIGEVPIPTRYANEKNYVNIWGYGVSILRSTSSYFMHKKEIRTSPKWGEILGSVNSSRRK
jgi:glycosyltransferase involved in cell wall biosynthesis